MSITLFNSILYGELRPWLDPLPQTKTKSLISARIDKDDCHQNLLFISGLLASRPELIGGIKKELAGCEQEGGGDIQPYVAVEPVRSFNRRTHFYQQLIEKTTQLYLQCTLYNINRVDADIERIYHLNLAIGSLVDILAGISACLKDTEEEESLWVLKLCRNTIMALILDLSLRYPLLNEVTRFEEEELYLNIMDSPCPDISVFTRTMQHRKDRLEELLKQRIVGEELVSLWHELDRVKPDDKDAGEASGFRMHLENAALLILMGVPVLTNSSSSLPNGGYCRESIVGYRKAIMESVDANDRLDRTGALATAGEALESWIPAIMSSKQTRTSEAAVTLRMIKEMSEGKQSSGVAYDAGSLSPAAGEQAVDYNLNGLLDEFTLVKDMPEMLKVDIKTVRTMIKKLDIPVSELTPTLRLIKNRDFKKVVKSRMKKEA